MCTAISQVSNGVRPDEDIYSARKVHAERPYKYHRVPQLREEHAARFHILHEVTE
jgi:hypothetical protein